jgi:hypothetical protein
MHALLQAVAEETQRVVRYEATKGEKKEFVGDITPTKTRFQAYLAEPGTVHNFLTLERAKAFLLEKTAFENLQPIYPEWEETKERLAKKRPLSCDITEWELCRIEGLIEAIDKRLRGDFLYASFLEFLRVIGRDDVTVGKSREMFSQNQGGQYWRHVGAEPIEEIKTEISGIIKAIRAKVRKPKGN